MFFPTAEGYYSTDLENNPSNPQYGYVYNYTDHLGNVRLSYYKNPSTGSVDVLEENNYYPFGLKHEGYNSSSVVNQSYQYKYNGKELQETGMYDYGARFYMPDIGRWGVVDPLAEKRPDFSPYVYCSDNPIIRIDPDGKDDYVIDKNGHITLWRETKAKSHTIYNSDKSSSLKVGLSFFDNKYETKGGSKENTILVNKNTKDLNRAYKFFAKNTNVEWQYNVFKGKNTVGTLATTHKEGTINDWGEMAYRVLSKDSSIKLIYSSHSHPGEYNSETKWPAYPSGFYQNLTPRDDEEGDRQNYEYYKRNYNGRIPSTFNIYVPSNPDAEVNYNGSTVDRIITTNIQEVVIKAKKKN